MTLEKRKTSSLSLASSSTCSPARSMGKTPKLSKTRRRFFTGSELTDPRRPDVEERAVGKGEAEV